MCQSHSLRKIHVDLHLRVRPLNRDYRRMQNEKGGPGKLQTAGKLETETLFKLKKNPYPVLYTDLCAWGIFFSSRHLHTQKN